MEAICGRKGYQGLDAYTGATLQKTKKTVRFVEQCLSYTINDLFQIEAYTRWAEQQVENAKSQLGTAGK